MFVILPHIERTTCTKSLCFIVDGYGIGQERTEKTYFRKTPNSFKYEGFLKIIMRPDGEKDLCPRKRKTNNG